MGEKINFWKKNLINKLKNILVEKSFKKIIGGEKYTK
jgi:hypothetical protein